MSNKTSDKNVANVTKSDIDILNALINVYEAGLPNCNELLDSEVKALKNVLAERKQDKARIQELEAINKMQEYRINEMDIPKQKVMDKIEELKEVRKIALERKMMSSVESFEIAIGHLEELLEGEK